MKRSTNKCSYSFCCRAGVYLPPFSLHISFVFGGSKPPPYKVAVGKTCFMESTRLGALSFHRGRKQSLRDLPSLVALRETRLAKRMALPYEGAFGALYSTNPTTGTNKKGHPKASFFVGAGSRGRTDTVSLPLDFESSTSANSIIPANNGVIIAQIK